MIKINGRVLEILRFPDGTPKIDIELQHKNKSPILFVWTYENDAELIYLAMAKRHLERDYGDKRFYLVMPYVPNARMDRTKHSYEIFTLKYFCEFINQLNFNEVAVLDAHSDVSVALLNNCSNVSPKEYIDSAINVIENVDLLYFPDAGAAKRYSGLFPKMPYCYGEKKRDWETGKILGLEIRNNGIDLKGKVILMVDDIISYGGSLHYSASELKKCGASEIYAYATHTENSILDKEKGTLLKDLEDGTVKRLITTDGLYTGNHPKIVVMAAL